MAEGQRPFSPESHNRNIVPPRGMQQERGGSRFFARHGSRPHTPTITREAPPPPTTAPAREQPPRKPEKNKGLSTPQKAGLGVLSLATLAGVPQAIPIVRHAEAGFLSHLRGDRLASDTVIEKPTTRDVFDPTAIEGLITPSMIKYLPQAEIDRLYPTAFGKLREDGNNTIIQLRQPISELQRVKDLREGGRIRDPFYEVREDKGTLQLQYGLNFSQSSDPKAKITLRRYFRGFELTDRVAFKGAEQGFYDTIEFMGVPKGTRVKIFFKGAFLTVNRSNNGKDGLYSGAFLDGQGPNGNIYHLAILGEKGNDIDVFRLLVKASDINYWGKKPVGSYGLQVGADEEILEVTRDLDKLTVATFAAIKGKVGEPPDFANPYVFTNLELISSDGHILSSSQK